MKNEVIIDAVPLNADRSNTVAFSGLTNQYILWIS